MYEAVTRSIKVIVEAIFLDEQSAPDEDHFVWAYQIRIENESLEQIQLINRHWRITDAHGQLHEVRGEGVVGEQPTLQPGDVFEYTSGTPLGTPSGIMVGSYEMKTSGGERFDIKIPAFSLDSPYQARRLN